MARPNEPEAFRSGKLENVTIRTIDSLLEADSGSWGPLLAGP